MAVFVWIRLVIDSISPLEPERKCFRMVGGVLVERTVKEVLPALETNFSGVSGVWTKEVGGWPIHLCFAYIDPTSHSISVTVL